MPRPKKIRVEPPAEYPVVRATEAAHDLVRKRVNPGDRVVDATVGNGHDTIFLVGLVGRSGHVDGFDIQTEAIESTRLKLQSCPCDHVTLHLASHEKMAGLVEPPVQAVMFNLGYLPGGDKQVVTQSGTTASAIRVALGLLSPTGIVSIVVYTGHPGGQEEANAVDTLCQSLDGDLFSTTIHKAPAQKPSTPFLVTITPVDQC